MANQEEIDNQIEFIQLLKANQLSTPNEFTIGMGNLIRNARDEKGISQAELAKLLNRRQATISDIENGKSEIGILTLVQFAVVLQKPISYFFPESLLKNWLVDVKSTFQHKMLEIAREIEAYGDIKLVLNILDVLLESFREDEETSIRGYSQDIEDEDLS